MKKMLLGAFLGIFAIAGIAVLPNYTNADETKDVSKSQDNEVAKMDEGTDGFSANGWGKQDTRYNAGVSDSDKLAGDKLLTTIRTAINWVLGILSFIALCLCLWGGFQMMTSGGDSKKYESGLNILKWAAIGLAVIAVSWLIVSLIFYVINGSTSSSTSSPKEG